MRCDGLMQHPQIILASGSQTRQQLLDRSHLAYTSISPDIDESACGETHADDLARRLAFEKARCIALEHPDAIVIGSDQVAWREHAPHIFIGKPLTTENAIQQLHANSGQTVYFSTALSVQQLSTGFVQIIVEHYTVKFRNLTNAEIARYVALEQPLQCAGSFKCEGLGISLFEAMQGNDQTTFMGLPLIQLCRILRMLNIQVP